MSDELVKRMKLDDRLEAYQPFFDHEWAKEMDEIAKGKDKLSELVFDLGLSFKGASTTAAIPLLSVKVAESYSKGHDLERLSNSLTLKLINHIAARIDQTIVLTSQQKAELKAAMLEIAENIYRNVEGTAVDFPRQELWDSFVKVEEGEDPESPKDEFRLGLWACQRICYSSLFFAYEDFLVRCLSTQSGSSLRSTSKRFRNVCKECLGKDLADECWLDTTIVNAKLVRHALAHAGGRETNQLKPVAHGIQVVDGVLQIMPSDVALLFDVLKTRAKKIAEWAVHLSAFR